jgi:NADH-quinone oxidoreductase subunit N
MTPHFDFGALSPQLIVAATFAAVLIIDLLVPQKQKWLTPTSMCGCLAAFIDVAILGAAAHRAEMFNGSYVVDPFALLASAVFTLSAAAVLACGLPKAWKAEYCQLLLASVLGMMAMASARDLLTFFVSFELFALPSYLLTGWNKKTTRGAEAAIKYYLMGVLATAVMLYGISLLYGVSGSISFAGVAQSLTHGGAGVSLARIAIFFVIAGMALKVSAVPFHFWAPDAYQGAPIPVAAFLSVASKVAGFVALLAVVNVAFPDARSVWAPVIYGLSVASMVVGNLIALRQTDAIRLLAYSAIAQSGYVLLPMAIAHGTGNPMQITTPVFEYLALYAVASLSIFALVAAVAQRKGTTHLSAFSGLFRTSPGLATALSLCLLSLAGVPPLAGWFAKFVVIRSAIEAKTAPGAIIAVIATVTTAVSFVYYLGFIRRLWLDPADQELTVPAGADGQTSRTVFGSVAVATLATGALLVVGVLPALVTHLGGWSSLLS